MSTGHAPPSQVVTDFPTGLSDGKVEAALALLDDQGTFRVNDLDLGIQGPMSDLKDLLRGVLATVPLQFRVHRAFGDATHAAVEAESHTEIPGGDDHNRYCFIARSGGGPDH